MKTKVQSIIVKNIKAIKEENLNLNGCSAIISGGNNKGKSTLLRTLIDRLNKKKPEQIVRQGEENGSYVMELTNGDTIALNAKSDTIKLVTSEGYFDNKIGSINQRYFGKQFDIDAFMELTPLKQAEKLQALLGLDFSALKEQYESNMEERKDLKRYTKVAVTEPKKPEHGRVDVSVLTEELKEASENNRLWVANEVAIKERKSQIDDLQKQLDVLIKTQEVQQKAFESRKMIDTSPIEKKINNA